MTDRSYRISEIVGTSTQGVDDAIRNAVSAAARDTAHLDWFEVVEIRGHIVDQQVAHTQVTVKLGSRMD